MVLDIFVAKIDLMLHFWIGRQSSWTLHWQPSQRSIHLKEDPLTVRTPVEPKGSVLSGPICPLFFRLTSPDVVRGVRFLDLTLGSGPTRLPGPTLDSSSAEIHIPRVRYMLANPRTGANHGSAFQTVTRVSHVTSRPGFVYRVILLEQSSSSTRMRDCMTRTWS